MNVLSLFDGISTGRLALDKARIHVDNYYASEVDKYCIGVSKYNYPTIVQLGSVENVRAAELPPIDLLIGGSPCTGFSSSGKGLNFNDPQSKLFYEYVRILNECKPRYFLFENVRMKKEWENIISTYLNVQPIEIDSSLLSAQRRRRMYWTNIVNIVQPEDKNITFGNVREHNVQKHYYTPKALQWFSKQHVITGKPLRIWVDNFKTQTIESNMYRKYGRQNFFGIQDKEGLRFVTPRECERLQTLPDDYTLFMNVDSKENVRISDTQRYKMIGNAWTLDVIVHILNHMSK